MDLKTQAPCQPRIELTDHILIEEWIEELDLISDKKRISYKDIKPVLDYLQRSRDGLTLYSETEGQLEFLQRYGRKSPKHYLGRSISNYMKRTDSQVWIGQHLFPTYTLNAAMCFI